MLLRSRLLGFWKCRRKLIGFVFSVFIIMMIYYFNGVEDEIYITHTQNVYRKIVNNSGEAFNGYLVWSPKCRIPDINIYTEEVKKLIKPVDLPSCSKHYPLTYIEKRPTETLLRIDDDMIDVYAPLDTISCCYSIVTRGTDDEKPDDVIRITSCEHFQSTASFDTSVEFVIVKCTNSRNEQIYSNGHSAIHRRSDVIERQKKLKEKPGIKPLSVLIFGIDSISRLNFYRMMPKTAEFIRTHGWIELRGYNKIGDNTYPNLMGILTGLNNTGNDGVCNPQKLGALDECPLIWYTFRDLGYVTAYAEDMPEINTFNFYKAGFIKQPTDHYFRPFLIGMEKELKRVSQDGKNFCVGSLTAGERIMDYAYDFLKSYENDTYFGFFWMSSFSHDFLNSPRNMDMKVRQFLKKLEFTNIFKNSMVIFLSDHGLRFGKILETSSGWLEVRLPVINIWLPKWFKEKYPQTFHNLKINSARLTTPRDLHMTLQDVLIKSGLLNSSVPNIACPKCQTLFEEVDWNRSCEDANITDHYCTCGGKFEQVDVSSQIVKSASEVIVNQINSITGSLDNNSHNMCAKLTLNKIISAQVSPVTNNNEILYVVIVETVPGFGRFEGTVGYKAVNNNLNLKREISRINMYRNQSKCVDKDNLKQYCYCQ